MNAPTVGPRRWRALAAPDKFRGTVTAAEAAAAVARGCEQMGWQCLQRPLADGGEGTLDALGGANRRSRVTGPLGDPVYAAWRLDGDAAVIEMAEASGLLLAGGAEGNDPLAATSRGTGELIAIARACGARRVILGVGGSASTDGGQGAVQVLAEHAPLDGSAGFSVTVAADVQTLFVDAAVVFGPQKGATTSDQLTELTHRLETLADEYRQRYGVDVSRIPGSGAAGGLAGGLAALGARIESGFQLVQREVGFLRALSDVDFVITGEGRLDPASFTGKVVGGVVAAARRARVPVGVIAGQAADRVSVDARLVDLTATYGTTRSMVDTARCISEATSAMLAEVEKRAERAVPS